TQTATLSSSSQTAQALLQELVGDGKFLAHTTAAHLQFFTRLAALIGARGQDSELASTLSLLAPEGGKAEAWQIAILDGLGQGLQNHRPLSRLLEQPPPDLKPALRQTEPLFKQAARTATDDRSALVDRLAAARLLGFGPFSTAAAALQELLAPR